MKFLFASFLATLAVSASTSKLQFSPQAAILNVTAQSQPSPVTQLAENGTKFSVTLGSSSAIATAIIDYESDSFAESRNCSEIETLMVKKDGESGVVRLVAASRKVNEGDFVLIAVKLPPSNILNVDILQSQFIDYKWPLVVFQKIRLFLNLNRRAYSYVAIRRVTAVVNVVPRPNTNSSWMVEEEEYVDVVGKNEEYVEEEEEDIDVGIIHNIPQSRQSNSNSSNVPIVAPIAENKLTVFSYSTALVEKLMTFSEVQNDKLLIASLLWKFKLNMSKSYYSLRQSNKLVSVVLYRNRQFKKLLELPHSEWRRQENDILLITLPFTMVSGRALSKQNIDAMILDDGIVGEEDKKSLQECLYQHACSYAMIAVIQKEQL